MLDHPQTLGDKPSPQMAAAINNIMFERIRNHP